jgi:tRNA U38,U39,U40 pseudouridine synthase TruA
MSYNPPDKWTEEIFLTLPDEDDRYEWKLGKLDTKEDQSKFLNKLAEELGALANSFGGTLFIGVSDEKEIIGSHKIIKGKESTKAWLESKIPVLFELRLQHFRVSEMELTKETQEAIGEDKVVIAITVFDSELSPHQCIHNKKYFYRVSSQSVPAPHHYLSFLWSRTNANMSKVAEWWFKDFFNKVIDMFEETKLFFNQDGIELKISDHNFSKSYESYINFFDINQLSELVLSNVGEHFLSSFPLLEKYLTTFAEKVSEFNVAFGKLRNSIEESSFLRENLVENYGRQIERERIPKSQYENYNLQEITQRLFGQLSLQISNDPYKSKECLIYFVSYRLLQLTLPDSPYNAEIYTPWSFSEHISDNLVESDESIKLSLAEVVEIISVLKVESLNLLTDLKKERIQISRRYGAII